MTKDRNQQRRTGPTSGEEASPAQDSMNELYAAHQVHTLAHLVFRRLSESWPQMQTPMPAAMGRPMVQPMAQPMMQPMAQPMVQPMAQPPVAAGPLAHPMPVPGPAILYWYP